MKNDFNIPINIHYCGREKCEAGHFFGPAIRSHYLMHFVLNGKGFYRDGKKRYEVKRGEVFLIKPHEMTYYEADLEEPWEYAWIAFDGSEVERMLEVVGLSGENLVCGILKLEVCTEYLEKIIQKFHETGYHEYELIGLSYLLFSTIVVRQIKREDAPEQEYLDKALAYIRQNYRYNILITDIARHVGIDRTYLFKIFKNHLNISPKKYLIQYRVLTAKDMLYHTDYNMTEVALSCGFYDLPSFCKSFKTQEHLTPIQYRKNRNITLKDR